MAWHPEQYLKFDDARRRPAVDLLSRLDGFPASCIVDLGCGPGNVTQLLAERWPGARLIGIDSDAVMLARAAATAPSITWQRADIASWQASTPPYVIFSNAALHWLDDHQQLFPRLFRQLGAGGVLAVQMPANFSAPSHRILRELAGEPAWRELLSGVRMGSVLSPAAYRNLLMPGCRQLDLWETTYWQMLAGDDAISEWMKGTTLVPYLTRLDRPAAEAFLAIYRARLKVAYPPTADGQTLFPFKRLFLVAQR